MDPTSSHPANQGDSLYRTDRLVKLTESGLSLSSSHKIREKAWYSKYLLRFGYGNRGSGRGDRELTATHSAPVMHSASRRSVLSDAYQSEAPSLPPTVSRRDATGRNGLIFIQGASVGPPPVGPGGRVNTLKQKMRALAARQYQVEAESLLTSINGKLARTKRANNVESIPVIGTASQSRTKKIGKGRLKHSTLEDKQERRKALRQILENAEEYMDGVKKCDEILRALPPLPLKKEYVEKWLTESSSDFTNSEASHIDVSSFSEKERARGLTKGSSIELSADRSDLTDSGSKRSQSAVCTDGTVSTPKKPQRKRKRVPQASQNKLVMGTICPVHSCTCTLNSNQEELHSTACPSNTVKPTAEETAVKEQPVLSSVLSSQPEESISTGIEKAATLPDRNGIAEAEVLHFFDPLSAMSQPASPELEASANISGLMADFEFPVDFGEQCPSGELVDSSPASPGQPVIRRTETAKIDLDLGSTGNVGDRRRKRRRGRFYFRFRLNSRVRRKLSSYIFSRKPYGLAELKSTPSKISLKLRVPAPVTLVVETPPMENEEELCPKEASPERAPEIRANDTADSLPTDPSVQVKDASSLATPPQPSSQNEELVASIANIFATLQSHVQRAEDDRKLLVDFIQKSSDSKATTLADQIVLKCSDSSKPKDLPTSKKKPKSTPSKTPEASVERDAATSSRNHVEAQKSVPVELRSAKSSNRTDSLRKSQGTSPQVSGKNGSPDSRNLSTSGLSYPAASFEVSTEEGPSPAAEQTGDLHSDDHTAVSYESKNGTVVHPRTDKSGSFENQTVAVPPHLISPGPSSQDGPLDETSSDNSAVYGTPRTDMNQSLLSLSTRQSRKANQLEYSSSVTPGIVSCVEDVQARSKLTRSQTGSQLDRTRKQKRQTKASQDLADKTNSARQGTAKRENGTLKSDETLMVPPTLPSSFRATETPQPQSPTLVANQAPSFYISSSNSDGVISGLPLSEISDAQLASLNPVAVAIPKSSSSDPLTSVATPAKSHSQSAPQQTRSSASPSSKPVAAPRSSKTTISGHPQQTSQLETVVVLLGQDAFRVNISDSTMIDSETVMTFHPAKSNSQAGNAESTEEIEEPTKLNVACDAERMAESELQQKLHELQTDGGIPTPPLELLEYMFYLLGLRGPQEEEDLFLPACHVEDSMTLWNAWKSKIFTKPKPAKPAAEDPANPINMYALHSIDRLFHFLSTYCRVQEWDFTSLDRSLLEANGDIKALYELFQAGVIEIPADRPKFFTDNAYHNRRALRLFFMNMFRFDEEGQAESVLRQKCLFYIHLFKNDAVGHPSAEQIAFYRDLLRAFRVEESTVFTKNDDIFVDIIVQQWLSSHQIHHENRALDTDFQFLREDTKRWLTQTTLINSRNRFGDLGALKAMAAKYLKGVLGNMSHESRTFISNILQIEQDPNAGLWTPPDSFLTSVEAVGLEQAVSNYIVPYRFEGGFSLPNQKVTVSKKDTERQETFQILEDICVQESISSQQMQKQAAAPPKADLKALSRTQFYKKQLKDPDIRKHLLGRREPVPEEMGDAKGQRGHANRAALPADKTELYERVERYLMNKPVATHSVHPLPDDVQRKHERSPTPSSIMTSDGSISVSLPVRRGNQEPVQYARPSQQTVKEQPQKRQPPASSINLSQYELSIRNAADRDQAALDHSHGFQRQAAVPRASAVPSRLLHQNITPPNYRLPVLRTDFLPTTDLDRRREPDQTVHKQDQPFTPNITRFVSAKLGQR